ncbi:MAG: hypothetical protein K9G60_02745 [Pseudolabrys sp.]|nr:hypothetical protein [Pseudolabrys sp.]
MKSQIIERLGQTEILLPALIVEGLAANDRVKVRLSILQAAGRRGRDPRGTQFDLTDECRAAGIDYMAMETLVNGASLIANVRLTAPGLGDLLAAVWSDVAIMARAVKADDVAQGEAALARLSGFQASAITPAADTIEPGLIAKLTGMSDRSGDSLHRLVMDLHKALNRLSATHAEEVVAGAHVFGLLPEDRPTVESFMQGIESTRKLKFGHPGLGTTVSRSGSRLTIQNDIGETDAHVVVINCDAEATTITYTDVHLARAKFFTGLLHDFAIEWSGLARKNAKGIGDDEVFYLVSGRFPGGAGKDRDAMLEAVGAALVFLIDWNKARKVLRNWISKADAVRVLDWAARHRVGHRGFLALGGGELVAAAVHNAAPTRIGFGERLDRALGRDAAVDFIKMVLRASAETLLEGGSVRLARDRIEAELVQHMQRADGMLLAIVVQQAGLAREIAAGIARFIGAQQAGRPFDCAALAVQARRIEEKADMIVIKARNAIARVDGDVTIARLVNCAEQAIDELEQAAFISSLVPSEIAPGLLDPLARLCAAALVCAEAAASGAAAAADVPEGQRVDSEDALAAVGRLIEAEHVGDAAERAVTEIVLRGNFDQNTALSVLELTRAIERATDQFAGFGHVLRDRVLTDLAT